MTVETAKFLAEQFARTLCTKEGLDYEGCDYAIEEATLFVNARGRLPGKIEMVVLTAEVRDDDKR